MKSVWPNLINLPILLLIKNNLISEIPINIAQYFQVFRVLRQLLYVLVFVLSEAKLSIV